MSIESNISQKISILVSHLPRCWRISFITLKTKKGWTLTASSVRARNIAVRERVAIINRFGEMIYNPTPQERRRSRRMVEFSVAS